MSVQNKWASYAEVKKTLRDEGIQNSLMFPAKLKLIVEDNMHFCETHQDAWNWFERYIEGTPGNGLQGKSRGKQRRPHKKPRMFRDETKLRKLTKDQADEEKVAAIQTAMDLATHHGSDHELGTDPKETASDSDTNDPLWRKEAYRW
ncbi:hypothetical protein NDU88_001562 [Pleurodeles waltl]|uniref:Uncharacterized protein n=1 Tax=Pleurodeles waltl TaxID=8319 RepID=A0AAV7NF38_PLEWA|nr:hypothetical protein NDU88_001562 [Pleurodeles waltl]